MSLAPDHAVAPSLTATPPLRLLPAPTSDPPYDDEPAYRTLRVVPARPVVPRLTPVEPRQVVRSPGASDVQPFAHALVQRLLEVCGGVRPLPQLRAHTTIELYDDLERTLSRRPPPSGLRPGRRDVRSVHVQEPGDGVAEVCATVRRGDRMAALALRLERRQGRWTCTRLVGV